MNRTKSAKLAVIALVLLAAVASVGVLLTRELPNGSGWAIRVACVGDSITQWSGYPTDLQSLLGYSYVVKNFGVTGATFLLNTDRPYINQTAFEAAKQFQPQIVVVLLGTNDARTNIYESSENLESDITTLVEAVQNFDSKPRVIIATPPPLFNNTLGLSTTNLSDGVLPRLQQTAIQLDLHVVDVYDALVQHPEYFPDGVHPNGQGAQIIANLVYAAIKPP